MKNITIGRYDSPEKVGYTGWITTNGWTIFVDLDGKPSKPFLN